MSSDQTGAVHHQPASWFAVTVVIGAIAASLTPGITYGVAFVSAVVVLNSVAIGAAVFNSRSRQVNSDGPPAEVTTPQERTHEPEGSRDTSVLER